MSWDDADFASDDPLVRFNAHQAAKGNTPMRDPDLERKRARERIAVGPRAPFKTWKDYLPFHRRKGEHA